MNMNVCDECGLPFQVCNALASYRRAVKEFERGRIDAAKAAVTSAEEFYQQYYDEARDATREGLTKAAPI